MNPNVNQNTQTSGGTLQNNSTVQTQVPIAPQPATSSVVPTPIQTQKPKKKRNIFSVFLILVIIGLGLYLAYSKILYEKNIQEVKNRCSPVSTSGEVKKLDLNSTIVVDLYNKVKTNIREDVASTELNDSMKLYLASRQISDNLIYDSNCNLFSDTAMRPFICEENTTFSPRAFKAENLMVEVKKLFGEETTIPHQNIQLDRSCIGGFQYIKERGEYVEGHCKNIPTTSYRVEKKLIDATSTNDTIVLKEEVKYFGAEQLNVPENLKSGTYLYTFQLDPNYNYVYKSKTLEVK